MSGLFHVHLLSEAKIKEYANAPLPVHASDSSPVSADHFPISAQSFWTKTVTSMQATRTASRPEVVWKVPTRDIPWSDEPFGRCNTSPKYRRCVIKEDRPVVPAGVSTNRSAGPISAERVTSTRSPEVRKSTFSPSVSSH